MKIVNFGRMLAINLRFVDLSFQFCNREKSKRSIISPSRKVKVGYKSEVYRTQAKKRTEGMKHFIMNERISFIMTTGQEFIQDATSFAT